MALSEKGLVQLSGGRSRGIRVTALGRSDASTACETPPSTPFEGHAHEFAELLAPWLKQRSFKAGETLWNEGDSAEFCILIEKGRIMACRQLVSGQSVSTRLRNGPGVIVGFPPLLDGGNYPTTVNALEELHCKVLFRKDLLEAIQDVKVSLLMFKLLTGRIRELFRVIEQVSHRSAVPRVASFLMALLPEHPSHGFLMVNLPMPSTRLSSALGLTAESFSRIMHQLVADGILHRINTKRYQILDLDRLRSQAQDSNAI